jgi:hypothetical protein
MHQGFGKFLLYLLLNKLNSHCRMSWRDDAAILPHHWGNPHHMPHSRQSYNHHGTSNYQLKYYPVICYNHHRIHHCRQRYDHHGSLIFVNIALFLVLQSCYASWQAEVLQSW